MGTWTCKCGNANQVSECKCLRPDCNGTPWKPADRPAGLSAEERVGFDALVAAQVACGEEPGSLEEFEADADARKIAVTMARAARAPLEAENKTLREQLGKATEMNHRQAKDIGGLEGYLGKDGTAFLHTGTPATVEAVRRIEELKAQLAQAQKPAGKSLADMIAESTTLAMGQRTAALETMIREFLKQTGAKVEDCVLVEQLEGTKLTWHIEHRPAPAGPPEVNEEIEVRSDGRPAPGREGGDVMDGTTRWMPPESRVTVLVRGAFGEKDFKAEMDIPESMLRYEANKKVEP